MSSSVLQRVPPYDERRAELRRRYQALATPATPAEAQDRVRIAFLLGDLDEEIYTEGQAALKHPMLSGVPDAWRLAYTGGFACQAARTLLLPLSQYAAVQAGLAQVQQALKQAPSLELFFLQASILFRLPVFLPERSRLPAVVNVTLGRLSQLDVLPDWWQRESLIFLLELGLSTPPQVSELEQLLVARLAL